MTTFDQSPFTKIKVTISWEKRGVKSKKKIKKYHFSNKIRPYTFVYLHTDFNWWRFITHYPLSVTERTKFSFVYSSKPFGVFFRSSWRLWILLSLSPSKAVSVYLLYRRVSVSSMFHVTNSGRRSETGATPCPGVVRNRNGKNNPLSDRLDSNVEIIQTPRFVWGYKLGNGVRSAASKSSVRPSASQFQTVYDLFFFLERATKCSTRDLAIQSLMPFRTSRRR